MLHKPVILVPSPNVAEDHQTKNALALGDRIILMEGKLPGSIKTEYMIDLPRPREHTSMELLKLRSVITDNTALVL